MTSPVRRSHRLCEQIARTKAANFYPAFLLLPRTQYQGMCALYAFLRVADDLSDEPGELDDKRRRLDAFRRSLDRALLGTFDHPLFPAFADTLWRFGIPPEYPHAALDGVCMDLDVAAYDTFEELHSYCWRVASVVGLACLHIWGAPGEMEKRHAESAGIAFQLTNILRDLGEDAARGRVYLPREDLARFGYPVEALARGERSPAFEALMAFEAQRAFAYYDAAAPLAPLLPAPGRAVFLVLMRTYRALLERIVAERFDVFSHRVRLGRWYKVLQVIRALPVRCGLAST